MKLSNAETIKKSEGLRLKAYLPTSKDVWTIGWGHTRGVRPGMTITEEEAEAFLREDVAWAEAAVNKLVKVGLNQNQFDALVSLVFNIGETNFRKSTLLRKLNAGDYEGAAEQFTRWKYQKGVVLKGLVRRRAEEMELFLSAEGSAVDPEILAETATTPIVKPILKSKEALTGAGAVLTGLLTALGTLAPEVQGTVSTALIWALVLFGTVAVGNRVLDQLRDKK